MICEQRRKEFHKSLFHFIYNTKLHFVKKYPLLFFSRVMLTTSVDNSRKEDRSFLNNVKNANKDGVREWNPSKACQRLKLPKSQLSLYNEGKRFDFIHETSDNKVDVTFLPFDSALPSTLENWVFHEAETDKRDRDRREVENFENLLASSSNEPEEIGNDSRKESSFDRVCGLTEAKNTLRNVFIYRILYPQFFPGNIQWNRVLLYGPPGTGKSLLVKAMAEEIDAAIYKVSSADILSQWHGETEKHIRALFEEARLFHGPVILFFDEIDGFCRRRNSSESDLIRRIKTELLMEFENDGSNNQMYLVGATNCPWDIDPAFLRRFHKKIYIPLPDMEARIDILKQGFGDIETELTADEWKEVGRMTEGYSGSDLANAVMSSCSERLLSVMNCHFWKSNGDFWIPTVAESRFSVRIDFQDLPSHQCLCIFYTLWNWRLRTAVGEFTGVVPVLNETSALFDLVDEVFIRSFRDGFLRWLLAGDPWVPLFTLFWFGDNVSSGLLMKSEWLSEGNNRTRKTIFQADNGMKPPLIN